MPFTDRALLIVDDAKFSAAIIAKRLKAAGYTDIRIAHHASDALNLHKERPCDLLIADWLMPDIDGIELCQQTRDLDKENQHYTYCLLVTAKETNGTLQYAFDHGLDDFIHKSDLNEQLESRVHAGLRIGDKLKHLHETNNTLQETIETYDKNLRHCLSTGLGNALHAEYSLDRTYRQTEGRGGAISFMSIRIANWNDISAQHGTRIREELIGKIAKKLVSLVRPLDEVCRIAEDEFTVIAHFKNIDDCNLGTYRRVYKGLNNQAYKTPAGFINTAISCAVCFNDTKYGLPSIDHLSHFNNENLNNNETEKPFVVKPWKASA